MGWDGFTYLGKHSWADMGLTIADRVIGNPNKIKLKIRPPFSNVEYDFSEIYGAQQYTNRRLTYRLNIYGRQIRTKEEMNWVVQRVNNWLAYSHGKQPLYDDYFTGYHFLAELEQGTEFEENWVDGTLDVSFEAYSFKIYDTLEGSDEWDDFDFDNGVTQVLRAEMPLKETVSFEPLAVGTKIIVGAWVQYTAQTVNLGQMPINYQYSNRLYTITAVEARTPSGTGDMSYRRYTLDDGTSVLEQDVIQSLPDPVEIIIVNPGITNVYPKLSIWTQQSTVFSGVTIAKDSMFYHYQINTENDTLKLHPGKNSLFIYGIDTGVKFEFYREVI